MPLWALLLLLQSSCGACAELARKIASQSPDALDSNAVASKLALYLAPTLRRAYARKGFDTSSLHALHSLLKSFKRALATTLKHIILGRLGSLRCCRRALDVLSARNVIDSNAVASKLALYLAPTLRRAYARKGFDTSSSHALPLPIEIVQEDPCNNVQTHNLGTVGGRNVAPLKIASRGWEELFFDGRHRPPHPPLKF